MPASTCVSSPLRAAPLPTPLLKSNVGVDLWHHGVSDKAARTKQSLGSGDSATIKNKINDLHDFHHHQVTCHSSIFSFSTSAVCMRACAGV